MTGSRKCDGETFVIDLFNILFSNDYCWCLVSANFEKIFDMGDSGYMPCCGGDFPAVIPRSNIAGESYASLIGNDCDSLGIQLSVALSCNLDDLFDFAR
jgi:hypothetical protein